MSLSPLPELQLINNFVNHGQDRFLYATLGVLRRYPQVPPLLAPSEQKYPTLKRLDAEYNPQTGLLVYSHTVQKPRAREEWQ